MGTTHDLKQIPKIDIHAHVTAWPQYAPRYKGSERTLLSPEALLRDYCQALNIEKSVLLPLVSPEAMHQLISCEQVQSIVHAHPGRFLWFCNVDPRASDVLHRLAHYKSLGACGVGEVTANLYADDPRMERLFAACEELALPVTIHIAPRTGDGYGIADELGLPRIERMLRAHPQLKLLGHSQCFWSEIGENSDEVRAKYVKGRVQNGRLPALLREYDNLYCDLSAGSGANALMRDRAHAARFIEEFADRLLYGCDICMADQQYPFAFDEFLRDMCACGELSEENYRKLVRGNACRLLGLDDCCMMARADGTAEGA